MNHLDIRELHTMEEFETVCRLYADIWGTDPSTGPVSAEVMRALSHA